MPEIATLKIVLGITALIIAMIFDVFCYLRGKRSAVSTIIGICILMSGVIYLVRVL